MITTDTIGDAYLVGSGILAPDDDGFWAVDKDHNAKAGVGRIMALAIDMMRAALEVGHVRFLCCVCVSVCVHVCVYLVLPLHSVCHWRSCLVLACDLL